MNFNILGFISAAVVAGIPILFGTSGEILTEKSGHLNLGVEGLMYMGGAFGLIGTYMYQQSAGESAMPWLAVVIALFVAFLFGALGSLIYSFLTVSLRVNQNVTGLALTIFGTGLGKFACELMRVREGGQIFIQNYLRTAFSGPVLPKALQDIPVLGKLLFSYNIFVYLGLAMALAMHLFISKTRKGLYLQAVGENPATADAAGINVVKYKYLATVIGGGISAMGGVVYVMTTAGTVWSPHTLDGKGWISVALVIFCLWSPAKAIWGSLLFGALNLLYLWLPVKFIPTQIYLIVPYIVTVVVLIMVSIRQRREDQPPAALGLAYFREER
ncbi:MAG: ABC transporter permease [Firmicutes bacterium]|nr:ABC transporter permease [Bacillota bacterium]